MHILFLTDNFPPEVNAPASRTFEHCREWVKASHRVTVVTCAPNFPKGKIFDGYRNRLWHREVMDGIDVIRVWSYITANEGFFRRTIDYMSFMVMAVLAAVFIRAVDVIVITSPHIFTACAGYASSRLKRKPFVFELRDFWPESIRAVGALRNQTLLRWLERVELFLYDRAAAIVCVTHSFKAKLIDRAIDPEKITVVTNGADLSRFALRPKDEDLTRRYDLSGKFVAGYVGTHGMAHALDTLLEAAALLRESPGSRNIGFVFLGDGAEKKRLKQKAAAMGLKSVIFIDTVPKSEVPRYWSLLDVSIIHLKKTPLFTTVIPSKLFEGMAMGIPVLLGVSGESADIVQAEGVGLIFQPENAKALSEGLLAMYHDPAKRAEFSHRGREAARRYDRANLAGDMLATLERVAGRTGYAESSA
jgi:glycosyltransferase involved in cell wall biosynthesis